jgi:hypothetical protein
VHLLERMGIGFAFVFWLLFNTSVLLADGTRGGRHRHALFLVCVFSAVVSPHNTHTHTLATVVALKNGEKR